MSECLFCATADEIVPVAQVPATNRVLGLGDIDPQAGRSVPHVHVHVHVRGGRLPHLAPRLSQGRIAWGA